MSSSTLRKKEPYELGLPEISLKCLSVPVLILALLPIKEIAESTHQIPPRPVGYDIG